MAEPFLAEIRLMSFGYAPKGWALCNGQLMPINQNQGLFSLLGTTFGGDGRVNFALPDLRARVPMHSGDGHILGERAGESAHSVNLSELPQHIHLVNASQAATGGNSQAAGRFLGSANNMYHSPASLTALNAGTVTNLGGSQAHLNEQPFLCVTFCIALQGIFPSPN